MRIEIKCFASLAAHTPQGREMTVPDGAAVRDVMHTLGVAPEEVKIIFINGVHATPDSLLKDNDRLGLIPAVGGG